MIWDFHREYQLIKKKGYNYAQQKMDIIHEKRAKQLYDMAISLGGVLIKLCQFFSARRDVFPDPYIKILSSLQDNVPPIKFTEIEKVLNREYDDCNKNFKSIDPVPLASASIGQVHKATLHNGSEVVLKILKPGVEKTIDTDLAILFFIFKLLSNLKLFKDRTDLQNVLDEFITITGDELNFTREAYIAAFFKENLKKLHFVNVPYIYPEYSTSKIIVMEYLSGDKITDKDSWSKRNNDPIILSKRIIKLYFEQFLTLKFINFDPHPGNILVADNNELVLLDFGMSGQITEKMRNDFKDLLRAIINRNYRLVLEVFDNLGFIKKGVNRYTLLPVIEYFFGELINTLKLNRESIQTADITPIIDDLVDIIYEQPFILPANWSYIGKTIGTVSGIVSTLNPDFRIYEELLPFAEKFLKDNIFTTTDKAIQNLKSGIFNLHTLPGRANYFIENIERGSYKFAVDTTDINIKIDESAAFMTRFFSFVIAVFSGAGSYICYISGKGSISFILLLISCLFMSLFFFYKKHSKKDIIKNYF